MDATTFSPQLPLVYDYETVLADSEPDVERMRAALDAGSVGVFDIDMLTGVSHFCARARRLWGFSPDEPVTLDHLRAAVLPDDRRELVTLLAANGQGTHEIEVVFRIVRPDRSERWLQARGCVHVEWRGGLLQPIRGLGAMFDVTARVESETRQRRLIEEQQRVSAERFDLATRAAAVGLYDFDIRNDSIDWSAVLREIWGVGPDDPITYQTFADGLHPEDRERVEAAVRDACAPDGDGRLGVEYRVVRRNDGEVRWVSGSGRVLFDEQRRAVRLIGTVQDITERKNMSLALQRTEELTRRVTDAVPGILYVYDLDERRNVWGNREVTEMLGYTREEIQALSGRLIEALLHPDDFAGYAAHEQRLRALRDDEIVDYEYRMRCANGRWLWLHSREMCFRRDAAGKPNQIVGAALNISDRKEYEERLAESERRLSAVLNNTTSSIFLMDDRQQCIYMNAAAEKLSGYTVAETQGRPLHDVLHHTHPDGTPYPLTDCPIDQAFPQRNQMQGEEVFVHKDGSFYPVAFTASPVMGDDDQPVGTVVEVRDIRAEKAAAEALRASREQLQVALDSADLASWELDLRTGEVDRTLRHDRIFGYEELQPDWNLEACDRHMLPEDRPVFRAAMEKALETGRVDFQVRVRWPDGSVHWIAPKGRTHYDERGRPVRMSGVLADVTRARQVEEELREADRNKDRFLAILSHELRNPLAPIRTAAHVLSQPHVSDGQLLTARQIIQRQVAHMSGLLDDLLDLARITQGKLELKCSRITLNEVVDSAVEAARPLLDHKRHTLDVQLPETPVRLDGDPLRLAQVLSNLLNNAAKYTDPGGHVELVARLIDDKDELRISVTDNGIGIDVAMRDKLFTMFGQAVGAASRAEGGLGIGLALVKGIVQLHGGSIEVHSDGPGRGSTFTVCLPLPRADSRQAAANSDQAPEATGSAGRRVLIADDNHDAADALGMLLGALGHDVRVVYGGQSALKVAAKFRPDVALLDIGMPDLDGYEVARRLRAESWGASVYLAAITGWGQDEDLERARCAGFNRHFTKPVDPDEVATLLQSKSA